MTMTTVSGMSASTFEKLRLIASIKKLLPLATKGELNRFGLGCRTIHFKDGTYALDAGGQFVRRLQVILDSRTHAIIEVRESKPWKWDQVVEPTYHRALEIAWQNWQRITLRLYDAEKRLSSEPELAKRMESLHRLDSAWNGIKGFFLWDAQITGSLDSLLRKLALLEQGLEELDTTAPILAASFWAARLDSAYAKGDTDMAGQLEVNLPKLISDRSPEEIASFIQGIKVDAESSLKKHHGRL